MLDRETVELLSTKRDELLKQARENLRAVKNLNALLGEKPRKSVREMTGFKVADAIAEVTEQGAKAMTQDALVNALIALKLWPGKTKEQATHNARRAITQGFAHRYLVQKGSKIQYLPSERNPRVKKKAVPRGTSA